MIWIFIFFNHLTYRLSSVANPSDGSWKQGTIKSSFLPEKVEACLLHEMVFGSGENRTGADLSSSDSLKSVLCNNNRLLALVSQDLCVPDCVGR